MVLLKQMVLKVSCFLLYLALWCLGKSYRITIKGEERKKIWKVGEERRRGAEEERGRVGGGGEGEESRRRVCVQRRLSDQV